MWKMFGLIELSSYGWMAVGAVITAMLFIIGSWAAQHLRKVIVFGIVTVIVLEMLRTLK